MTTRKNATSIHITPQMIQSTDNIDRRNPYSRAANSGLIFGLYLSAIFATWILSASLPGFSLLTAALTVLFPVVLYIMMRRDDAFSGGLQLTTLWICGIIMVTGGAVITAAVSVIYLKWGDPQFILRQLENVIAMSAATSDPTYAEAARLAQGMIDNHVVPSATMWMTTMWLFTVSSGSILAGLLAMLIKVRSRYRRGAGR